jgi:hypothetical protein
LDAEPELPVWGVDSDALIAVLRCFYTGRCQLDVGSVIPILDAAQRLEVAPLARFAESYLARTAAHTNVCALLGQALHFRMPDVVAQLLKSTDTWCVCMGCVLLA